MTIKLIPEFWRNQEISEKYWKTYKQVKLELFRIFDLFLILFLITKICLANLNEIIFFSFLGFAKTKHEEIDIKNLC